MARITKTGRSTLQKDCLNFSKKLPSTRAKKRKSSAKIKECHEDSESFWKSVFSPHSKEFKVCETCGQKYVNEGEDIEKRMSSYKPKIGTQTGEKTEGCMQSLQKSTAKRRYL